MLHAGVLDVDILLRDTRTSKKWSILVHQLAEHGHITISGDFDTQMAKLNIDVIHGNAVEKALHAALINRLLETASTMPEQFVHLRYPPMANFLYQTATGIGKVYPEEPQYPFVLVPSSNRTYTSENPDRFSDLKRNRKHHILIDALKVIEPRLETLELFTDDGEPTIYGYIGLNEPIPLSSMGEGIDRVTSIILAMGSASGGVVAVDEIENGLHYSVMKDVWQAMAVAAREFDVQLFATTHSLECINAAHEAFQEADPYDFRLHRLDRLASGKIQAVTFDRDLLQSAKEANFEIR